MKGFDIDGRTRWLRLRFIAENTSRPLKKLVFPLLDLVGVHVELRKRQADPIWRSSLAVGYR
jgi:hypothetical protein